MSVASPQALVRTRSSVRDAISTPDVVAASSLALYVTALLALTWRTWGDLDSDTGYDIVAATRDRRRRVPYRDFIYYYGPLAPALGAVDPARRRVALSTAAVALGLAGHDCDPRRDLRPRALVRRHRSAPPWRPRSLPASPFIPNNYNFVLPHTAAATLGLFCVLVLLIALGRVGARAAGRGPRHRRRGDRALRTHKAGACRRGSCSSQWRGLSCTAKRAASGRSGSCWRPRLVVPAVVYGIFAGSPAHTTYCSRISIRADVLQAGGDVLVRVRMPLTLGSIVEIGGRAVLYGDRLRGDRARPRSQLARGGRMRTVATAADRRRRTRRPSPPRSSRPEALRHGLQFVYAWIPAGALIALVIVVRRRRRAGRHEPLVEREIVGSPPCSRSWRSRRTARSTSTLPIPRWPSTPCRWRRSSSPAFTCAIWLAAASRATSSVRPGSRFLAAAGAGLDAQGRPRRDGIRSGRRAASLAETAGRGRALLGRAGLDRAQDWRRATRSSLPR